MKRKKINSFTILIVVGLLLFYFYSNYSNKNDNNNNIFSNIMRVNEPIIKVKASIKGTNKISFKEVFEPLNYGVKYSDFSKYGLGLTLNDCNKFLKEIFVFQDAEVSDYDSEDFINVFNFSASSLKYLDNGLFKLSFDEKLGLMFVVFVRVTVNFPPKSFDFIKVPFSNMLLFEKGVEEGVKDTELRIYEYAGEKQIDRLISIEMSEKAVDTLRSFLLKICNSLKK